MVKFQKQEKLISALLVSTIIGMIEIEKKREWRLVIEMGEAWGII